MLEKSIELLKLCRETLEYIQKADKTPPYNYGRRKRDALPDGEFPSFGRWLTPRESAWGREQHINKFLKDLALEKIMSDLEEKEECLCCQEIFYKKDLIEYSGYFFCIRCYDNNNGFDPDNFNFRLLSRNIYR